MSKDVEISYGFGDKRKASPESLDKETAKRPAISGLIEPSLTTRFLSDPIISDICNNLAKDQFIVQRAHQLLEAFQGSTVMEDGNYNDSAFEHFSLVRRTWRNHKLRVGIDEMIVKECVVPEIIDKLSNDVEDEKIEEQMCRIKGDHDLGHILQLPNHPATMIRGLLIILFGYWRYRKLPSRSGEEIRIFDEDIGTVTGKLGFWTINKDWSDLEIEMHRLQSEAHTTWLMERATPIQKLDEELFIDKLADDLKDLCLFGKAKKCMESLHKFNPKDDGTLIFAKEHCDLAHEVLEDSDFVHFLFDSIKRSNEGREYVNKYGKRAKVENEDVVATVKNIVKDPGFLQYKERIEKNEVRAALRVFLSILITHWMYEDVRKKVNEKLAEYAEAEQKAEDDAWKATGYDDVEDDICYHTRFAGDLKGLKEALEKVYGTRPYEHMFNEIRIMQFEQEVITREKQFDVAMVVKVSLYHGSWAYSSFDFHDN